jgi:acid phosphatase family membrane protein YuiD
MVDGQWADVQGYRFAGWANSTTAIKETFMDISSINSSSALSQLLANQASTTTATSSGGVPTDSSAISSFANLMSELQQLQQNDPTKFKAVMADIASTLKTDAQNATGSQASFLNKLADKFDQAAQTGQMPNLQPQGAQGAGGHHHHHHVQSYQSQAADTDGTSSAAASGSSQQTPFNLAQVIQNALQTAGVSLNP